MKKYNPKQYWESRLSDRFTLRGVGHKGFSEAYNQWIYKRKKKCLDRFFSKEDLTGKEVLDIGCGTGFFIEWYLNRGAKVCGLDITQVSIDNLKKKFDSEFYVQDITDPNYPLQDREFDIVNMWDVIYHIVDQERFDQALSNIAKSLKKDGLFLFTDWFGAPADRQTANHVRARSLSTYQEVLAEKGFELVKILPLFRYLNNVRTTNRLDNHLGRLYYLMDNQNKKVTDNNLSLGVWKYRG